jgi:uncharacterized membrane protein
MHTLGKEESQHSGFVDKEKTVGSVGIWSLVATAVLAAFYFATSLYISSHRLLWVDEISTVNFARLPGWASIWKVLNQGVEGMPPTYFMAVRLFDNLFGNSEIAVRLPSALAMTAGLLITLDCARRLTDGLHGLIAFSALTCSFLPYYGHEARSYALYFMLAALALWIWVHAKDQNRSSAVLFGAVLFLGVTMHYYAVLCLVPYAVWEISNWKPWRLPSQKMIGGGAGIFCAAAVLWMPIQAQRHQYPHNFWARPSPDLLPGAFSSLFPDSLFLLALIVVWIALVGTQDRVLLQPMQPYERVSWLFLLIPPAGFVLAEISHVFQLRYFISALPGIAVAFSCWLWRHFRGARRVSVGVFLILATWGGAKQVTATRNPNRFYYSPIRQMLSMENALRNDGKRFFVVCNQARYMEALYYSKHSDEYALLPSLDSGDLHMTLTMTQYYPMQLWTLEDLKKHAQETALLMPLQSNLDTLKQAGFEVETRFSQPLEVVYLK